MRSTVRSVTLNGEHEPTPIEDAVLCVFRQEREQYGENRMTPALICDRDDSLTKQNVNYALGQLVAAGWVQKLASGLYEFQDDPRDGEKG